MSRPATAAGFSLSLADGLWRWTTFTPDGQARACGSARTRALAAAEIVRDICRACEPGAAEAA